MHREGDNMNKIIKFIGYNFNDRNDGRANPVSDYGHATLIAIIIVSVTTIITCIIKVIITLIAIIKVTVTTNAIIKVII